MITRDIPKDIAQALIRRIENGVCPAERPVGLVYEDDVAIVTGVHMNSVLVEVKGRVSRTVYAGPLAKSVYGAMEARIKRDREWQMNVREIAIREALGI